MGIIRQLINSLLGKTKNAPTLNDRSPKSINPDSSVTTIKRAEEAVFATNEALRVAKKSKDVSVRNSALDKARDSLAVLIKLTAQYPYLTLEHLQDVKDEIIAIEAKTRTIANNEFTETPLLAGLRLSESDEQGVLMCIQSCLRVVNESIEIARKSKNIETKLSRLGVARDKLKEAQRQANQFSLQVDGFDAAEAEINRIDEALRNGTPTEIAGMPHIELVDPFASPARDLLKVATALKKEKKYIEACDKLREAYSADGAENLMIEDRLRLPMYLQLSGKGDEGWDELNRLLAKYTDQFSQPRIEYQMNIFLRKEKNESATNPVRVILRGNNKQLEAVSEPCSMTSDDIQNAASPVGRTVGELQSEPMSAWGNDDIITGLEFIATLQLRTPLRVLLRHGEIHTERTKQPPQIAHAMWEGIWYPRTRLSEWLPTFPVASDVGTVLASDYLPFLVAVRRIVELNDSIENRIEKLREMPIEPAWQAFVQIIGRNYHFGNEHVGMEGIVQYFFPRYLTPMPNFSASTLRELSSFGLDTIDRIAAASDEVLLAIKGIGPAKLKAIRGHFADITKHRDVDRIENVFR